MKKFALLLLGVFTFISCDLDDDGENRLLQLAEITEVDLPEHFETGEEYDLDLTYLLPTACHSFHTVNVHAGQESDEENRVFYIGVFTSYDANLAECNEDDDDLSRERTIHTDDITGEVGTVYTFHFWTGEDAAGDDEYLTVEVPVVDPDDLDEDEDDEEDDGSNEGE